MDVYKCTLNPNRFSIKKTSGINTKKLKICFKYTTTDNSNLDKRCSDFVSFLFYYYCNHGQIPGYLDWGSIIIIFSFLK